MSAPVIGKLTVAQVCEELGVSRSTFYCWRQSNKAPRCIKLPNGEVRVRRTDLDEWLAGHEESTKPTSGSEQVAV